MHILQSAVYMQHTVILPLGQAALLVAELSERTEANYRSLFEILRYWYIYIFEIL